MRRLTDRMRSDQGFTLVETVVTMTILSAVMAIFTTGITQMFQAANSTEFISTAQAQNNIAFLRLDKQVRYATGISKPGVVSTNQYVEFLTSSSGTPMCSELRVTTASKQLQERTWKQGGTPGAWSQLATNVTSTQAFTYLAPDAVYNFQRLQFKLTANSGSGKRTTTAETNLTFTALNTSLSTSSDTVCTEGRTVA